MMRIMSDHAASNYVGEGQTASVSVFPIKRNHSVHHTSQVKKISSQLLGIDSILNCYNQSECIKPHLELTQDIINIYFCKHTSRGEFERHSQHNT
jgi:hypothetical protein